MCSLASALGDAVSSASKNTNEASTPSGGPLPQPVERDPTLPRPTRRRWSPDSLASRLILLAITLVSATAVVIGSISYVRARSALENETQAALNMVARNVADDVNLELVDAVSDITNWSRLEVMRALLYRDVDKELAEFFRGMASADRTSRFTLPAG